MLRLVANADGMDMVFMSPLIDRSRWRQPNDEDKIKDKESSAATQSDEESIANIAARQMRRLQDDTGTPVVGVMRSGGMARMMGIDADEFFAATYSEGIGSFPSVARAARTVSQLLDWREYRQGLPEIS